MCCQDLMAGTFANSCHYTALYRLSGVVPQTCEVVPNLIRGAVPTSCQERSLKVMCDLTCCFLKTFSIIHLHCGRSAVHYFTNKDDRGPSVTIITARQRYTSFSCLSSLFWSPPPPALYPSRLQPSLTHTNISLSAGAKAGSGSQPGRQPETTVLLSMQWHEVMQVCISSRKDVGAGRKCRAVCVSVSAVCWLLCWTMIACL